MGKEFKLRGYLIDNRAYYSIESKVIISLDGSGQNARLRSTKARLFEYLLEKTGEDVISDNELLENIWDKSGLSSSSQRLWLVMRELKEILSKFNVAEDFFARVESSGYLINTAYVSEIVELDKKLAHC